MATSIRKHGTNYAKSWQQLCTVMATMTIWTRFVWQTVIGESLPQKYPNISDFFDLHDNFCTLDGFLCNFCFLTFNFNSTFNLWGFDYDGKIPVEYIFFKYSGYKKLKMGKKHVSSFAHSMLQCPSVSLCCPLPKLLSGMPTPELMRPLSSVLVLRI